MVSKAQYEVHMTRVLHTAGNSSPRGLRLRISVLWYITQRRRRRTELAPSLIRKPKELKLRTYSAFSALFQVYGGRRYKEIATTPPQACSFTIERLQCV